MKKNYVAPLAEIVRFDSEEVLNALLPSGVGHEDVPEVGDFEFGDGSVEGLF